MIYTTMNINKYLINEIKKEDALVQIPEAVKVESVVDYLYNELYADVLQQTEDTTIETPNTVKEYFTQNIGTSEEDLAIKSFPIRFQQNVDSDNKEISFDEFMGMVNADALRKTFNPKAQYVKNYLFLDTDNTPIMINPYSAQWKINSGVPVIQNGVINVNYPIRNIIGMRLGPLLIECSGNTQTLIINFLTSVLIGEFISQACISQSGSRYHFIGTQRTDLQTFQVALSPTPYVASISFYYYNNGIYMFNTPITTIDTLTLQLYSQFQPIQIPTPLTAVLEIISERVEPEIL